jgi:uncharacterized membrane protein HdeD (DUF308 family)
VAHTTPVESPLSPDSYARFAKRDLDKMSWLAPLVNNRAGDLFNLELRHEQLFFVRGDQLIENIGYSEKGKRFSEEDYGKTIHTFGDLKKYGYWFVGRTFDPGIMREALQRQRDGYYYSILSNQCQDWADRLKRGAERLERERGIAAPKRKLMAPGDSERLVLPTEPASIGMGLLAVALGVGGLFAPAIAGGSFTVVLGVLLLAAGVSNIVYALHSRDWRNLLAEVLPGLVNLATAALLFSNRQFANMAGSVIIAISLAVHGGINLSLGLFNRPRSHWIGKLASGAVMLGSAAVIVARWPASGERLVGAAVGLSLLVGGLGTIWLSWRTRMSAQT